MVDAHNLFRKATKVLTDVNSLGQQQWPAWGWGGEGPMTQSILGQFQRHARFTIFTGSKPIYLVLGYTDLSGTGEAHLTVWVESDPRKADLRMDILKAAENGGLDGTWVPDRQLAGARQDPTSGDGRWTRGFDRLVCGAVERIGLSGDRTC